MVAAGLYFFARRVFPNAPGWEEGAERHGVLKDYVESAPFKATRHGAADFRLDRMSLYLYGEVADMYASESLQDLVFIVLLIRSICNDSSALRQFFLAWRALERGLLTIATWDEDLVRQCVERVWDPSVHDMGYGARMLPQVVLKRMGFLAGRDGDNIRSLGCRWLSQVADRLKGTGLAVGAAAADAR